MPDRAVLLLEDGSIYEGRPLGAAGISMGELVFSTLMSGTQQLLTTPACTGQILTMTNPLVGNTGTNSESAESPFVCAAGLIVRECDSAPSNFRCEGTLEQLLIDSGTVGLQGIDTRSLTRRIRRSGRLRGVIASGVAFEREELLVRLAQPAPLSPVPVRQTVPRPLSKSFAIALLDYGCSNRLLRQLTEAGCDISPLPPEATLQQVRYADGVLLSDGLEGLPHPTAEVSRMLEAGLPILGIGAGHQVLAQAAGFSLEPLPCGHHGANHPVLFCESGHSVITFQHHRLAIRADSVDSAVAGVSHINQNDGSVEGLVYRGKPAFSLQFIPDAAPPPHGGATAVQQFCGWMKQRMGGSGVA